MFDRNQLVHAVIWPSSDAPTISLIDPDGIVYAYYWPKEPVLGSQIAKMVPEGFTVDLSGCEIVSMSGRLLVSTVGEFDTAVVTERAEVTFEERMLRLERREARREKREAQLAIQNRELQARIEAAEAVTEPVPEPTPAAEPEPAPEPAPEPSGEVS